LEYKELFQLWKSEKESQRLQKIPTDFYISIDGELTKLYQFSTELKWRELGEKVISRLEYLRQDLTKLRLKKILDMVINEIPIDPQKLTWGEKRLVEHLQKSINNLGLEKPNFYTQDISPNMSLSEDPETIINQNNEKDRKESDNGLYLTVRILDDIERFIGIDNRQYGPFKKFDVVYMPRDNAKALIAKSVARVIENTWANHSGEKS